MKQIGIVLLLTALAALGFWAVRFLDAPAKAPATGGATSTGAPRPAGPGAPAATGAQQAAPTAQAPTTPAPARPQIDWKSMQKPGWIVPLAERWQFDLSGIDLEAELLCTVGGVPITRDDFRAFVCMTDANALVETRLAWHVAADVARQHGGTIGLDDAAFETLLAQWGQARGLDREGVLRAQAQSSRLTMPAALQMRRWTLETMLAQFQHVALYEQLPAEMRERTGAAAPPEKIAPVLTMLQEARANLQDPENLRKLGGALETLALFWGDTRRIDALRRTATVFDRVLEPGEVAAVHTGAFGERVEPPWLIPGARAVVRSDELWPLIGPHLSRGAAEERLRELIWFRVLQAELERSGHMPEPETVWMAFWQEHEQGEGAVMGLDMIQIMLNGFPTLHHYRGVTALRTGFFASQPEGWRDADAVRQAFEENRFFIQRWNPEMEIALFPAQRPVPGGGSAVDWEGARAEAEALWQEVQAGGDFSELREAQQRALLEAYKQALGDSDAESFRQQLQLGELVLPFGELRQRLQETRYDELVDCVSVLRSAVVELDVGEVSPPWRTNLGWALLRINGAIVGGLEQEFEDVEFAARQFLEDALFMKWANGVLQAAELE